VDKIDELLSRGVENIIPDKEVLEKILRSGKKLRIYQGFDPSTPNLHIGHLAGIRKLRQWQDLGHEVIFLVGDFTGMIGDPSGKDKTRSVLTHEQTLENAKTFKEQASKVLRFDGENPAKFVFNGEWLTKLTAIDITKLASLLTISQLLERDMFQKRF
jgi:tyrosyl-tRNA synthetase